MSSTTRRNILVIEDEQDVAELLQARLESAGYDVHVESEGQKGLSYAAEHRPDLVILDLMLPDIDGYQVCRTLQEDAKPWTIPVLMLTAKDQPADKLVGFLRGAGAYLTKPYEASELLSTIEVLLAREHNE
jgi:DNA-binding response OmpR family regulator